MDVARLYGLLDAKHKMNMARAERSRRAASNASVSMPGDAAEAPSF